MIVQYYKNLLEGFNYRDIKTVCTVRNDLLPALRKEIEDIEAFNRREFDSMVDEYRAVLDYAEKRLQLHGEDKQLSLSLPSPQAEPLEFRR
jgi:hypothetical protein